MKAGMKVSPLFSFRIIRFLPFRSFKQRLSISQLVLGPVKQIATFILQHMLNKVCYLFFQIVSTCTHIELDALNPRKSGAYFYMSSYSMVFLDDERLET